LRQRKIIFIIKTRRVIGCVENFYNAGVVTRDRRIGSRAVLKNGYLGLREKWLGS
jgi:hypothetical protein